MRVICKSSLMTKTQQRLKKDNNMFNMFDVLNNILVDNNKRELIRIDSNKATTATSPPLLAYKLIFNKQLRDSAYKMLNVPV